MAGESAAGWSLHFYDFQRRFVSVDDVVPGWVTLRTGEAQWCA